MRILLCQILLVLLFPKGTIAQCDITTSKPTLAGEQFVDKQLFAGSKYLLDEWAVGDVTLKSGDIVKQQLLKYNALEDELIWFEQKGSGTVRVDKSIVLGFTLEMPKSDSVLIFTNGTSCNNQLGSFLQVLRKGRMNLYANRWVEKTSNVQMVFVGGKARQAIVIAPRSSYFVETITGDIENLALNRRSFVNTFSVYYKSLSKKLLRQNRIRIRNEHDLVSAIEWVEKNL